MEWRSPSELRDLLPDTQVLYCCYCPFLHDVYADAGYFNERGRIVNGYGDDFSPDDERFYGWMLAPEPLTERME